MLTQFRQELFSLLLCDLRGRPVLKYFVNFVDFFPQVLTHCLCNKAARRNQADLTQLHAIGLEEFVDLGVRVLPTHHHLHDESLRYLISFIGLFDIISLILAAAVRALTISKVVPQSANDLLIQIDHLLTVKDIYCFDQVHVGIFSLSDKFR